MIKTPEYHDNKILEADFGEDLESSVLTYAAETSEEAEVEPEEINQSQIPMSPSRVFGYATLDGINKSDNRIQHPIR